MMVRDSSGVLAGCSCKLGWREGIAKRNSMKRGESNRCLRVLHVVQTFDLAGRSRMIQDLCAGLKTIGVESTLAVLEGEPGLRQTEVPCVRLHRTGGMSFGAMLRLVRLAQRGSFAVLHSHGRGGAVYASLASRLLPARRWIHTIHRSDGDRVSGKAAVRTIVLRRADHIAAVSEAALKEFEVRNGAICSPHSVIHNGIRFSQFSGLRSARPGGAVLGAIMNLSPDKDFDTLLRGLALILRARPDARLLVVGEGPARRDVEGRIAAMGLSAQVELLGFRRDVPELLCTFNLLLHSTRTEGLGLVILEAMAAGVPVVASAVGGIPEIVSDGVTGRLFPAGDANALCAATLAALGDETAAGAMAVAALADVRARFSVESMCEAYRRLYLGDSPQVA